jgi:glycosyltransferase involved in cell wall biosynthesis
MDKLKIGVYLDEDYDPTRGGNYSYSQQLIHQIDNFEFDNNIDIVFVSKKELNSSGFKKKVLTIPFRNIESSQWSLKRKLLFAIFSLKILRSRGIHLKITSEILRKSHLLVSDFLSENNIDIIYYLTPQINPFNYCYIITHWDIGIKSKFHCQKIFSVSRYEEIDHYNRIRLHQAFAIFTESEQSKRDLIEVEKVYSEKIFVVPLMPGGIVKLSASEDLQKDILNKWKIEKNKFFFYPAQFWGHKNHYSLIQAFKLLSTNYPELKLVLSGSDKGNMPYIKRTVEKENLGDKVIFTGFIPQEDLFTFYKNAIALVMPTLLGPTNMPPLEAYYLGCKVICSNLKGHMELMGSNADYFDPFNYAEMAQKMDEAIKKGKSTEHIVYNNASAVIINGHFQTLYKVRKIFA